MGEKKVACAVTLHRQCGEVGTRKGGKIRLPRLKLSLVTSPLAHVSSSLRVRIHWSHVSSPGEVHFSNGIYVNSHCGMTMTSELGLMRKTHASILTVIYVGVIRARISAFSRRVVRRIRLGEILPLWPPHSNPYFLFTNTLDIPHQRWLATLA